MAGRLGHWSNGRGPLYRQLADALGELIATGELHHDDRLPPERAFAIALAVSRGTVVAAYELLRERGTVERRQGSGTRVIAQAAAAARYYAAATTDPLFENVPEAIDLLKACPDIAPRFLDIADRHRLSSDARFIESKEPAGIPPLREGIAKRYSDDGLPTTPEQILVTNGAQQAITLITWLFVKSGDTVVTEFTTWPGLVDATRQVGGRVHGIPMDEHGIMIEPLTAAVERLRPTFIGLNPHHHNPTGSRLSPDRRRAVADLAADYGVPIVEDRVFTPIAFDGNVPPPLAVHRPEANIFVVDSLDKAAWSGLRIGWVRADPQAIHQLRSLKAIIDLWSPIPSQLLAVQAIDELDAILRERIDELRPRAAFFIDELRHRLPEWELAPVRGGFIVWARLPYGSASAFARFAARYGVAIASGREFSTTQTVDDHLRLPFTLPEPTLREAVDRLAQAWDAFSATTPSLGTADTPASVI